MSEERFDFRGAALFASEQVVPYGRERVFEFFSDPFNLERITPPWLRFEIVTPRPIDVGPGALIDYRPRLHGLPLGKLGKLFGAPLVRRDTTRIFDHRQTAIENELA